MNWMDFQSAIVYFRKSKKSFYYAVQGMQEAVLENYFKKNGVNCSCYKEFNLGTSNEIVDEILAICEDTVVFHVECVNLYISSIITHLLREEAEDLKIIWFGDVHEKIISELIGKVDFDAYVLDNYEKNLVYLIKESKDTWTRLENVVYASEVEREEKLSLARPHLGEMIDVYSNGVVAYQEAAAMGIMLGRKLKDADEVYEISDFQTVIDEFHKVVRKCENLSVFKLIIDNLFAYGNWEGLMSKLYEIAPSCNYEVTLAAKSMDQENLNTLIKYGVNNVEIFVENDKDLKQLEKNIELLSNKLHSSELRNVIVSVYDSVIYENDKVWNVLNNIVAKKILRHGGFNIKLSNKCNLNINEYGKVFLDNNSKNVQNVLHSVYKLEDTEFSGAYGVEVPLLNGFELMKTGKYDGISVNGTKHVLVEESSFNRDIFEKLRDYTSVNSGFFVQNADEKVINQRGRNYLEVGCDAIKYENEYLNELYRDAFRHNYFLSHVNFTNDFQGYKSVQFNNYYRDNKLFFAEVSFSEKNEKASCGYRNYLRLDSMEDLERLVDEADYFVQTGKIDRVSLYDYSLVNHCRWGGNSSCGLNRLPRIQLNAQGTINACIDSEESLGSVEQWQYETIKKSYEKNEQEYILRKCVDCPVAKRCSKCIMLPKFLTREDYCRIRREHPYLMDYLLFLDVYKYLKSNSNLIQEKVENIRVISECGFYLTKHVEWGSENDYLFKPTFIIYMEDKSIMWSPVSSKFFKVSKDLVYVVELMLKNLSVSELVGQVKKDYKFDEKTARKNVEKVFNFLFSAGCMKRQILVY